MQHSLALCMIVKPGDEPLAEKAIESVKDYVDNIYLTITGDSTYTNRYEVNISEFEWIDDFSAARTFNFSQAKEDWILWLDADDILVGGEYLKDSIKQAEANKISGFFFKYKYGFDKNGNCIDEHWKMQLLKNDGHFEWRGAIHEDPIALINNRWVKNEKIIRVHQTTEEKTKESFERNLRILLKERDKNPNEPRTLFYLGRTYLSVGEYQKAVDVLDEYLGKSGWDEERYEAKLIIGNCYFQTGDYDTALKVYNEAILEREDYADAYIQKAMTYLKKGEFRKALHNLNLSLQQKSSEGSVYYNPMTYGRDVYIAAAICYMNLGHIDIGISSIQKALSIDPKNEQANEVAMVLNGLKKKYDLAENYFKIAREIQDEEKIQQLLATVPIDISDNALILALRNTYLKPKKWGKKSIAVYCGSTVESWTPDAVNGKGIGGSETAVVELTKRLAKEGWDVTVFNSCDAPPEGLEFDGVKYENHWKFNVQDEFDVLWVWRLPELFDYDLKARLKILDLHDVMSIHDLRPERVEKIDKVFVKSKYHRSLFPQVADDKFEIVGNGIDLNRFEGDKTKEPYRFVYSSTANRGLDILLEMWPKIREKLPEAELHVYYGWKTFYEIEKNNPERMAWMKKVQGMMKQDGVIDHGRVGQKELAKDLLKTSFWLYPTYFPEIHCITACEMQAAGVIPITSGYAALQETQQSGIKLEGDVYDPEWQEEYIKQIVGLVEDKQRQKDERNNALSVAKMFSWDIVAQEWERRIK